MQTDWTKDRNIYTRRMEDAENSIWIHYIGEESPLKPIFFNVDDLQSLSMSEADGLTRSAFFVR